MKFCRSLAGALVLSLLVACSDDDRPGSYLSGRRPPPPSCDSPDDLRACATAYYYSGYDENRIRTCNETDPITIIDASVETPIFRGNSTSDPDVAHQTRALQRYFEPHALWFQTGALSVPYPINYVMRGSPEELNQAFDEAGLPLEGMLTPEQDQLATEITGRIIFSELRAFLAEHALDPSRGVNVVVIPDIVDPRLEDSLDFGGEVVGFGISPALFERLALEDPGRALYELLGVGQAFTPTLLVGFRTITRVLRYPDAVIAHEMGHALGLPHREIAGNLMDPIASPGCRGGLLEEQVAQMGPFASRVAEPECQAPTLFDLTQRLARNVLARRASGEFRAH